MESIKHRTSWIPQLPYEVIDAKIHNYTSTLLSRPKDSQAEKFTTYGEYMDNIAKKAKEQFDKNKEKLHERWGLQKKEIEEQSTSTLWRFERLHIHTPLAKPSQSETSRPRKRSLTTTPRIKPLEGEAIEALLKMISQRNPKRRKEKAHKEFPPHIMDIEEEEEKMILEDTPF